MDLSELQLTVFKGPKCEHRIHAQASDEETEGFAVAQSVSNSSSGSVLPFVAISCLGAILFGYHLGVVNGALEYIASDLGFASNPVLQGWVISSTIASAAVGSVMGGALADKFGCICTFQLDSIPLILGALLSATAQNVQAMISGRVLVGLGIGVTSSLVPLYISEISPTEIRGTLGSLNQLFICIGILVALVAGLPLTGNPAWWRTMFMAAVGPAVLLGLGMSFSPESPRWLFKQGKILDTEVSIKRLWGRGRVDAVMAELRLSSDTSYEEDAGWGILFNSRYRKVVSVGAALFLFQQFAGIRTVVYNSTAVFHSAGIVSDVAGSALVGAANVIGTMVASSLMDKQGRKKLLITSFLGMAISMIVLALGLSWPTLAPYSGTLALLGTVLYVLAFSLGAAPVPDVLLPEIFASRIRAKAVSLSLGVYWVTNFIIDWYFLRVVWNFGIGTVYLVYGTVCLIATVYIARNVVETKGKSLEEIEMKLNPVI